MAPRNARAGEAPAAETALAPAPRDELAAAGLAMPDDADDGLGEASGEDIKIAAKVLNMRGRGPDGRQIPADAFYDTVDQTYTDELDAVLLYLHKTNAYTVFNNETSRTETVCRSFDRKTGTMEATGKRRPCEGCPDNVWYTEDGKRRKNCGPVYNVAALDRATMLPFWLRFKRTALPVIKQYLQRHHLGRRVVGTKRLNYPLFAFSARLRGEMTADGKYALPVITRGPFLGPADFAACMDAAATIKGNALALLTQAEATLGGDSDGDAPPDTSFNYGAAADGGAGEGEDYSS